MLLKKSVKNSLFAVLLGACAAAAQADGFDQMRLRWEARLAGDPGASQDDADVRATKRSVAAAAQRYLVTMDGDVNATALWSDAADWNNPNGIVASATVTSNYARIETMAMAYAQQGTPLYRSAALRSAILHGLEWMDARHYHARAAPYGNWWDWQIGVPLRLVNVLTLMNSEIAPALLSRCLAAIDRFVPDPGWRALPDGALDKTAETGANRLDKALVVALRGVLGRSARHVKAGRDAISQTLVPVSAGDGFYADGSFVQHAHVAYTGSYGLVALDDYAKLIYLFSRSDWPIGDALLASVFRSARETYAPWIFDGAMADAVRGRRISSRLQSDHEAGRRAIAAIASLAQAAPPGDAAWMKAAVKGWIERDMAFGSNYLGSPTGVGAVLSVYDLHTLKAVMADPATVGAAEEQGVRIFASMDRVLQRGPGFGATLSMFSDRISAFEFGNGEHARSWWNGIGMLNLYNADQTQYDANFWPTVDAMRLPGTTTDRSGTGLPKAWNFYANRASWVGGAQINGRHASIGMAFDLRGVTGSDLQGKKSWFMFGDKIVATGSDISSGGAAPVETIVENRKLNFEASNPLTVNGELQPLALGAPVTLADVRWAHLAGSVPGAGIGYYFPQAQAVTSLRESRTDRWQAINGFESPDPVHNAFLSLAIGHGIRPQGQGYIYVLLPGASAAATAAYAAHPTIELLANDGNASAVHDKLLGLTGINFWNPGMVRLDGAPYVGSDSAAAVVLQEQDGKLTLGVADPTQHNMGEITIEVHRRGARLVQADPAITVIRLAPTVLFKAKVGATAGRSLNVTLAFDPDLPEPVR
ncbi:MAG: polysaccharide lyase 8 family protein [Pseudomonadota bacterium]